jgi:Oligopeptide/dipeptide transporter, C-terminal region
LLNSFPALHGPRRYMTGIPGSPPDLRMLPVGCVFHPRCPYAMDICREQSPPLEQPAGPAGGMADGMAGGRLASCWLQDGTRPVPAELAQPEPGAPPRPGAVPRPAGTPSRGTVPPGTLPPGTVPPGTVPPGTVPPGTVPPGTVPPGMGAGQLAPSIAAPDPGSQS